VLAVACTVHPCSSPSHRYNIDKFDKLFGVWITKEGKRRRLDIVMVPPEQWAYALIGWTGSIMLNRFMRRYARDQLGYCLTNHGIVRIRDRALVPNELPGDGRTLQTEKEVFEFLGLPYIPPHLRNA
jgi:DNA polymerase mu